MFYNKYIYYYITFAQYFQDISTNFYKNVEKENISALENEGQICEKNNFADAAC